MDNVTINPNQILMQSPSIYDNIILGKGEYKMCNEYNGHANYPTWCVSLWIDNDEGLYSQVQELAIETYNGADGDKYTTKKERATWELADQLDEIFSGEYNPLAEEANLYSDLLGWALDIAEWNDIAENWIDSILESGLVEEEELEEDL